MGNLISNLIVLLITVIFLVEAYNIKLPRRLTGGITPDLWPKILLYAILGLTILSCISAWWKRNEFESDLSKEDLTILGSVCFVLIFYMGFI